MALKALLIVAVIQAVVAAPAMGADYIVGDDAGWKLNVNYTAWVEGKQFHVGDRLIFKYTQGSHNVHRLSVASDFQQCTISAATTNLTTGNDVITLASSGKKWYACGISDHCSKGMKVGINVVSAEFAPSPAPIIPNESAASGNSGVMMSWAWVLATLALLHKIIMH